MRHARIDYNKRIVDLENKIPEEEPVFLLRGQDKLAPKLLLMWASELRLNGGDPAMARSAEDHAQEMINWQKTHKVKTPDMYRESTEKKVILAELKKSIEESKSLLDIQKWLSQYYDGDQSQLMVLMPFDLMESSKLKQIEDLTLDDFNLDSDMKITASKVKLIVFCKTKNKLRILTSRLPND